MKIIQYITGFFLLVFVMGCTKQQTDYKDFFDGHEIVYTGTVGDVVATPGNLRTMLKWKSSTDPSIVKYVLYYNNKADSSVVNITDRTDSVSALISNLQELSYSFTIYSFDAQGNKSVPKVVNNVKVYGPIYQSGLLNRAYNAANPYEVSDNGDVQLNFNTPDTINITTRIKYTSKSDVVKEVDLAPSTNSIKLTDYKPGTEVSYRSSYTPERASLDVFETSDYAAFPTIIFYIQCDKSLFKENKLANDAGTYEPGTSVSKLWDGSVGPQGYPNIFHSNGESHMPQTITFDMGKVYNNLGRVEETGRNCCNNPDNFEIWGIEDITNAATTLDAYDPGWKDQAIAKGWTLLKEVTRTDDGSAPLKVELISNPPPVRYIRVRIKHVTTGDNNYSNMSEMTFWNKQ